jgi:hypothetical protein
MARIASDELDRLKALDLVRLIDADGLALKRIGKDLAGRIGHPVFRTTPRLALGVVVSEGDPEDLDTHFLAGQVPVPA